MYNSGVHTHFDVVVIDEAGQAIEPEALAVIGPLLAQDGQIILAGDPYQLGPIVHSKLAERSGLCMSFMERLMGRPIYQPAKQDQKQQASAPVGGGGGGGSGRSSTHLDSNLDGRVITKLVRNYRSHEDLTTVSSRLFYDGEIVAVGSELTNAHVGWSQLPNREVPLIFHGVKGMEEREANSPSWFNRDEAGVVLSYVQKVLAPNSGAPRIRQQDIGIIAPYSKQVWKIHQMLRSRGLHNVAVGSTENFQGQERRVIIVTSVRSSTDFLDFDAEHNLGFLDNPKRFNVAITRAIGLMIIVGDPSVLQTDPHWNNLLQFALEKQACKGVLPSQNEAHPTAAHPDDNTLRRELESLLNGVDTQ